MQAPGSGAGSGDATARPPAPPADDARSEALASPAVQALLDVFPAEIRDVEEI
jgi:hypothetical protein